MVIGLKSVRYLGLAIVLFVSVAIAQDDSCVHGLTAEIPVAAKQLASRLPNPFIESTSENKTSIKVLPLDLTVTAEKLPNNDGIKADISFLIPPGSGNGDGGGGFGSNGNGAEDSSLKNSTHPEEKEPKPDEKEPQGLKCWANASIIVSASVLANLAGSYAENSEKHLGSDARWIERRVGVTSFHNYLERFKTDNEFIVNNLWNVTLMVGVTGAKCVTNPGVKRTALIAAVTVLTSLAAHLAVEGKMSARDIVLDAAFVTIITQARLWGWGRFNKKFFGNHHWVRQTGEKFLVYLFDQWLGGFGYGFAQRSLKYAWGDKYNFNLLTTDDLPEPIQRVLDDIKPKEPSVAPVDK